jgi:hypothetical protein
MRRPARKKKAAKRTARRAPARTKKKGAARGKTSSAKRAAKKRPAKKRTAKRTARKRPAPRRARRATARRATSRRAKARTAKARRPAARRSGARVPAKPKLAVVRARRPKAPPPPAFPQTAGASPKQVYLFELVRARAAVLAAIQGLTAHAADQPMGEGKWSVRLTVIHLIARDRARLHEIDAAVVGRRASWIGSQEQDWARLNAQEMAPLSSLSWDEALRLLQTTRQKVTEAVESIPEDLPQVWAPEHTLMEMLAGLPPHDRHHAEIIKRWRETASTL